MKIKKLTIEGFRGNKTIVYEPDPNISIITGTNGCGKTNVIKMIWSIISGNIIIALKEIPFSRAILETTNYTCKVTRVGKVDCIVEIQKPNKNTETFKDEFIIDPDGDKIVISSAEDTAKSVLVKEGSSLFFPTFRRIEGGFGIDSTSTTNFDFGETFDDILTEISRKLSNEKHKFITSISAEDVSKIAQKLYLELSARTNAIQNKMSRQILEEINIYSRGERKDDSPSEVDADTILQSITKKVEGTKLLQAKIMKPIEEINNTIKFMFHEKDDDFIKSLNFGKNITKKIIDKLSSGEKQVLGFIAYNAMCKDSIIFIDEPELSLHTDWQRQLFPVLLKQNPTNQFIVSTHSPLIYAKYSYNEYEMK